MTALPSTTSTTTKRLATGVTLAFLFVYVAWGMTYMGLHFALESFPPFVIGAGRFLIAGWILLGLVAVFQRREFHWGSAGEWRDAAVVGTVLFLGGNGAVAWAQQFVNTSTAALIFGTIPLFILVFDWLRPGGVRPTLRTALGLVMGFAGLCVLIQPAPRPAPVDTGMEVWGKLALLFGAMAWAAGAIYSRSHHAQGSALLPMARQMICGGVALAVVAWAHGDWARFHPLHLTRDALLGFAYLLGPGSLLGFTAYAWLLRVSTPARVSTITYVNTVVAVALGWLAGEPLTARIVAGAVVIVASVVIVLKKGPVRETVDQTPAEA
jgi:drug/metabolite transporter (DMT)-like permease